MQRFKVVVRYNGQAFFGWQRVANLSPLDTVQVRQLLPPTHAHPFPALFHARSRPLLSPSPRYYCFSLLHRARSPPQCSE